MLLPDKTPIFNSSPYPQGATAVTHMWHEASEIHLNPNEHRPPSPKHTHTFHCVCTFPKEKAEGLHTFSSCRIHSLICTCMHAHTHMHRNRHTHTCMHGQKKEKGVMGLAQQSFMCVIILSWYCPNPPLIHYPSGKMKLGLPFYLSPLHNHLLYCCVHVRVCVCVLWGNAAFPGIPAIIMLSVFFPLIPGLWFSYCCCDCLCVCELILLVLWGHKSM